MSVINLVSKIEEVLNQQNLSERKACLNAEISIDFIRNMRRNGNPPKTNLLIKLAQSLNVDIHVFLNALNVAGSIHPPSLQPIQLKKVFIRGEIQAGQWKEAIEWPEEDWVLTYMPPNPIYEHLKPFALRVKGDSMNLLYPDGSIIVAVNFYELGRNPEDGECVVTIRRDPLTDHYEATLKIVQIRDDGSVFLWPRSNHPEYTKPIQLPKITTEYQEDNIYMDTSSTPDVIIQSLVIYATVAVGKIKI